MSDHQFQEREYEEAGGPVEFDDLVSSLMEHSGPLFGRLPQQYQELLESLPRLTEKDLARLGHRDNEATCPVCITPLPAILAEEEMALAMDSPAHPYEELGVTRLWFKSRDAAQQGCGHIFCRKCISKWIGGAHDSCPTCRRLLIQHSDSEPMTGPPNASAEEALRQLQEHMRAARNMGMNPPGDEGRNNFPGPGYRLNGLEIFGGLAGTSRDRDDRSEYSGMYS